MKKILAQLNLISENLEKNSDILNANSINLVMARLVESEKGCPDATQDIKLNLMNRQKAIDEFGYGPADPSQKNEKFWKKKMDMWKVDDLSEVKNMLCGNCAAFDISSKMLDCIEKGIGDDENSISPLDTIDAGHLGYCRFLKFKCASERTCDAWVTGGPITDQKKK
jgi:hypothetical protein